MSPAADQGGREIGHAGRVDRRQRGDALVGQAGALDIDRAVEQPEIGEDPPQFWEMPAELLDSAKSALPPGFALDGRRVARR